MCSFSVVCPVSTSALGASVQRMPAVSRPAWMLALSGFADRGGGPRRSPVEIVATMGTYLTRTQADQVSGLRAGPFGRWADGGTAMREDCAAFARHWQAHNDQVLAEAGPLWVVLGDSTAQRLGAHSPDGGYVGQILAELRRQTGSPPRASTRPSPVRPARPGGPQPVRLRFAHPRRARCPAARDADPRRPRDLRHRHQRHPVHQPGQAVRRPAYADRGPPGPDGAA